MADTVKEAPEIIRMKKNFVVFLHVLWAALNLPKPTKCQLDMARSLVTNNKRRFILQAFRGIGKSFILCAFVVWKLWNDPQKKILIVSASKERADANSIFVKRIITLLPFLSEMQTRADQRDSVLSFDVGLALPDHSPSVKSAGITGQITGSRADIILADDVETPNNSSTQLARDRLGELVKEFDAILKPEGVIIYLGTPQTEMTLYRELEGRGYETTIWPARYPKDKNERDSLGHRLAPMLADEYDNDPEFMAWTPTDPVRFDDQDLKERELSYGKAGFALQFQLNPNLADADKYPLKLRNLIVAALESKTAPLTYQWLPNRQNCLEQLPAVGLKGDLYHRYESTSKEFDKYSMKIMAIDPSGRGKDETGYVVLYFLNGYIYLMDSGGFRGGYDDGTLESLAKIAKKWEVNEVLAEGNFGDGMWLKVFSPILNKIHNCALTETKSKGQKEVRIADTLEPVLGAHRLVVSETCITKDYQSARNTDGVHDVTYSLFYQFTRLNKDRGSLKHDDRLDALAIGVAYFLEVIEKDVEVGREEMTLEFLEEHMKDLTKGFNSMVELAAGGDLSIRYEQSDDDFGGSFMSW